nr:putative ribonuclease H-like domain-containing protein [Tanacetum cinerariifolium]
MTLIKAARTMLADLFLPTTFWAETVNTTCYVVNRILVTKPQNKTPYEILTVENQANKSAGPKEANNSAGTQANDDQGANSEEINLNEEHFVLPIWSTYSTIVKSSRHKIEKNTGFKTCEKPVSQVEQDDPHRALKDKGIIDSRCSRHMQGTKLNLLIIKNLKITLLPLEVAMEG